jgi:hypothetical protein
MKVWTILLALLITAILLTTTALAAGEGSIRPQSVQAAAGEGSIRPT